jgi:hypothetical protein
VDLVLCGHGETVLVQCKQWHVLQVGVDKVRELLGVLYAEGATRGILVTSGTFTNEAKSFKVGKPLTLVDGLALGILVREVRAHLRTTRISPSRPFVSFEIFVVETLPDQAQRPPREARHQGRSVPRAETPGRMPGPQGM